MSRVQRLQRVRYAIDTDVRSDAAFESTPRADIANATHCECEYRVLQVRSRPLHDGIGLEKRRFDLHGFESAIQRIPVGVPCSFDERGASVAVQGVVSTISRGDRRNGHAILARPG